jgi:hypothetical protein
MEQFAFTQADVDAFDKEMADFRAKSQTDIGEIIQAHLIIEYYMNLCLATCFKSMRNDNAPRLTFQQKVELLPGWVFGFPWIRAAVLHLNRLRNKIAHNIHFTVTAADLAPILKGIEVLATLGGKPKPEGMQIIHEVCKQASMALYAWSKRIDAASEHGVGAYELRLSRREVD